MLNLFGEEVDERKQDRKRETWNRHFQKWSDEKSKDETTPYGKCGYGVICDWCKDNSYGRPCVRALNTMLKEKRFGFDYETEDFESVFMWGLRKG